MKQKHKLSWYWLIIFPLFVGTLLFLFAYMESNNRRNDMVYQVSQVNVICKDKFENCYQTAIETLEIVWEGKG